MSIAGLCLIKTGRCTVPRAQFGGWRFAGRNAGSWLFCFSVETKQYFLKIPRAEKRPAEGACLHPSPGHKLAPRRTQIPPRQQVREAVRIARERARRRKPVQIRAEALDQLDLSAAYHVWQGFASVPGAAGPSGDNDRQDDKCLLDANMLGPLRWQRSQACQPIA
jgi:hypothetical protein